MNSTVTARGAIDFSARPILVFWETTRSCLLACRHCRASAVAGPQPGELDEKEGRDLIDQVVAFGRPYPILVFTGGDCLLRRDLFDLVRYATSAGVPVALSPSVSPLLDRLAIRWMVEAGVKAVSVSLDGADAVTHDGVRGVAGHHAETIRAIAALVDAGLSVQVNTTVMRANVEQLADVAAVVTNLGVHVWEVFFLVHVGRGVSADATTPAEHEDVCNFLYDASHYGVIVRTVEAPFFRRVVAERNEGAPPRSGPLYRALAERLRHLLGPPTGRPHAHTAATRDGKGIVFVAHDGEVHPAGFLPLPLGNVRTRPLSVTYRDDPLLRAIRAAEFTGSCGRCGYADRCGGSRARAYAATGDPLGEDPACPFLAP